MRILAIAGSLRAGAVNRRLLEAARLAADDVAAEIQVEILDTELIRALPHFDEDLEAAPGEAVARWRQAIEGADALLFATPEYNSSIPGALKNALDWASRPREDAALAGRPAAVIGASPSPFGAVWAQAELRKVLGASGARVIEGELALGGAGEAFAAAGRLADPAHNERLAEILEALVAEVRVEQRQPIAA